MVCCTRQSNLLRPDGDISGESPSCTATLSGLAFWSNAMKTCPACKKDKMLTEFSKNRSQRDGYCSQCKICTSEYLKTYQKTERYRTKAKVYAKSARGRVVQKGASTRFYQSEKGKAAKRTGSRNFRLRHPDRIKARSALNTAVIYGKLPRPDSLQCCYCRGPAQQYHHY
ncbi:hypothetical protein LCGC14_2814630, partial [marine sediment metagenome]